MEKKQVIIFMAAYQGEAYLKEQLDSILAQDYPDWKLIARDDCSKDRTLAILKEYEAKHPERIFVEAGKENKGAAKNFLGLLQAHAGKGEAAYYMFADQDDFWHPDKISRTLKRMRQMERRHGSGSPAMVFTDAAVVDEEGTMRNPSFFQMQHLHPRKHTFAHLLMENVCIGCTVMMNRSLAKMAQETQKARYHDWWMALTAAAFGHISYLPEATMDYRQHGKNVVGSESFPAYVKRKCKDFPEQKKTLLANYNQAEEFQMLYEGKISKECERLLTRFATLRRVNPAARRAIALKEGFLKSGLARNIGLMLIL